MLWMLISTAFLLNFIILSGNESEDLLGKGDHNTASNGEHAVGPLRGVVALEGQAQLEDTEAQQDQADGSNQGEDELGKVVDYRQRIVRGKGRDNHNGQRQNEAGKQGVQFPCAALILTFSLLVSSAEITWKNGVPGMAGVVLCPW